MGQKIHQKILISCVFFILINFSNGQNDTEVIDQLQLWEVAYTQSCKNYSLARWEYLTNVTQENAEADTAARTLYELYQASVQREIKTLFPNFETSAELNEDLKRELRYLAIRGPGDMPEEDINEMNQLQSQMTTAYAEATVCEYQNPANCNLHLEPDIEEKLRTATDYDELAHYWTAWHDAMGQAVKPADYTRFIRLQNSLSVFNGFGDMSQQWLAPYYNNITLPNWSVFAREFKTEMKTIWSTLKPNYNILHAYVRMKLRQNQNYTQHITKFGRIPASLMGNMWSQHWTNLDESTKPYPEAPSIEHSVTQAMISQGWNETMMFRASDDFFTGLGLLPMTQKFWDLSMLKKPEDGRTVVCHASAHDFCDGQIDDDFRIKQCTVVTMDSLITAHHEMGHVEYFQQYARQRILARTGANPAFHEAIGDALALAVSTPKHLKCVLNLYESEEVICDPPPPTKNEIKNVTQTDINFLYYMALDKIAFFPFAISMDSWRWEVLETITTESDYNRRWWELRAENQGISPPLGDRDSSFFDPAAKYHIVANVEYIRYFKSYILQFQLYQAMCIAAGEFNPNDPDTKPLYQCDFSGNIDAGNLIGNMMELGFSKPWADALEVITGSRQLSTEPLINYFKPLFDHLSVELEIAGEKACFGSECEEIAGDYLANSYESQASEFCKNAQQARWDHQTDLANDELAEIYKNVTIAYANFRQNEWENTIRHFEFESMDPQGPVYRQLKFLNAVGTAALPQAELEEFTSLVSEMSKIYGEAKVCPYLNQNCDLPTEGLSLEPDLETILENMEDYYEMAYVWAKWRDASGKNMRTQYNRYLDLSNMAAQENGYADMGEFWLMRYESESWKEDMNKIWEDLRDFYEELHAYVRYRLNERFPEVDVNEPLPAHILGNMWAQTWGAVERFVLPYPDEPSFDITPELQNFPSIKAIFQTANSFFVNTGMNDMSVSFGDSAIIEKPNDGKELICHASAWDFCDKQDFRIKMCTQKNMNDFFTTYHELGHIQYYTQYKDLPITFRTGANPGFHEAIGDVISLSVNSPAYLYQLSLIKDENLNPNSTINFLMKMALEKVAFLPFGLLIDSYRWDLFSGEIPRANLTYNWLKLRNQFQGIVPPLKRNEMDFDAGAKYHIPADVEYMRYFVSNILQFQIFKELCKAANNRKPLFECNFHRNQDAGNLFKQILQSGGSKNWQQLLSELTDGDGSLSVDAINEYFQPLKDFLVQERMIQGYPKGWDANAFEDWFGDGGIIPTGPQPDPTTPIVVPTTSTTSDPTGTQPPIETTTQPNIETTTDSNIEPTTTEDPNLTTTNNPTISTTEEIQSTTASASQIQKTLSIFLPTYIVMKTILFL